MRPAGSPFPRYISRCVSEAGRRRFRLQELNCARLGADIRLAFCNAQRGPPSGLAGQVSRIAGSATPATMPALARFGQNGPVEWATRAWAQTAQPLGSNLRSPQRSSSETATKTRWPTCSARQRSPARRPVRETGRFPSHAARIGAGLSPLPHLRRRADPPLLACLLTRLAMRDRNRDTRPALRQQAVGGGGSRLCGRPPPRCLKLATVEDLRPGSGRALPGRKASASLRVRRTPLSRRTALAASY
jgi:hypothetical protein